MNRQDKLIRASALTGLTPLQIEFAVRQFHNGMSVRDIRPHTRGFGALSLREFFTEESWPLITVELAREMGDYLTQVGVKSVLEVCAGKGLTSRMMQGRVEKWIATDAEESYGVEKLDAMSAIDKYQHVDLLFASWIPYESTLDVELARKWVVEMKKPMMLISEPIGGCTGSMALWDEFIPKNLWMDSFISWHGIHDEIYIIQPKEYYNV